MWRIRSLWIVLAVAAAVVAAAPALAQLVDATQTTLNVPGGAVGRSLEDSVGAGHGDEFTPGSAVYLIRRDPARSVRRGRQLFQRKFTADQGFGPRVRPDSTGDIQQEPALGARLVDSCAGCHGRPRGAAGFGGDVATRPDSRDAPHLFGLGLQEMLADEMTRDLRAQRDQALRSAASGSTTSTDRNCRRNPASCGTGPRPVTQRLVTKGVSFGELTAFPDGRVDLSRVQGVDDDLRVRPFFHHGATISIREFAIGASRPRWDSRPPIRCCARRRIRPSRARSRARRGSSSIRSSTTSSVRPSATRSRTATPLFMLRPDSDPRPQLVPVGDPFVVENLFTDMKRHDLGPAFHEREYDGTLRTEFLTEALWGVGTTAPYGHDGRSINLEEVILRHGGEASRSRNAFAQLREDDRRKIYEFLATLILFPPDDTASNLNPGDPSGNPQQPASHGSIHLGALFQIAEEGTE